MADGRSLLTGLFVGGLIGGAAVLLSAPSSGKELRGKIKENCNSIEDTIKRLKKDGMALTTSLSKRRKKAQKSLKT